MWFILPISTKTNPSTKPPTTTTKTAMSFVTLLVVAAAIVGAHGATPEAFAGRQAPAGLQAKQGLNTSVSTEIIGLHGASHAGTRGALHIVAGPLTPPGTIPASYHVSPTANDTTSTKIADDKTTSYNKTTNQMTRSANPNPPPLHPIGGCRVDTSAGTTAENTEAEAKNNNKATAQPCVRPGEPAKNHVVGGALLAPARVTPAALGVDTIETPGPPPSTSVVDTKSIADTGAAVATGGRPPGAPPDIMTPVRPPLTRTTARAPRHLQNHHEVPPPGDLVTTNNTAKNVGQGSSTLLSSARDDVRKEDEVSLVRTHALCRTVPFPLPLTSNGCVVSSRV